MVMSKTKAIQLSNKARRLMAIDNANSEQFKSKSQALSYAKQYMRTH